MKSGVLIALIFCGTLLLLGPTIIDNVRDREDFILSQGARMTLLVVGGLMILGGIAGAIVGAVRPRPRLHG
jgi:hypothetical protein